MSTMSEGDEAGQRGGIGPDTHPGAPQQGGVPSQEQYSAPYGSVPAQARGPGAGRDLERQPGEMTPSLRAQTRVTGRRVLQYLIDSFLVGIIPSLVSIPFDRSNSTAIHVVGGIVAFVVFVVIGFAYWVILTHRMNGQTLAMKLVGVRVISKGGGKANIAQLTIRWVCLIVDAIPYTWPFTGLVGFIVILCSRDRQRIGDHLARTVVIATGSARRDERQYAGTDSQYTGTDPQYTGEPGTRPGEPGTRPGEPGAGPSEGTSRT